MRLRCEKLYLREKQLQQKSINVKLLVAGTFVLKKYQKGSENPVYILKQNANNDAKKHVTYRAFS